MSKEFVALALTLGVHVLGAVVVIWGLLDEDRIDWRSFLWPRDGGGDGPGPGPEPTPVDPGAGGFGGLPLPDARQAPERMREPGRLADLRPRPPRRPAHTPAPERVPARPAP